MTRGSPDCATTKRSTRRGIVRVAIGACVLAVSRAGFAQKKPAKIHRISILYNGTPAATAHLNDALMQGLREHGHVDGTNVSIERRYAEGKIERLPELAAELVRSRPDVIVTTTDPVIAAVKQETRTIPIVMVVSSDPVGTGFVMSLARPGGNITGLSVMSPQIAGKRLELLKEIIPGLTRAAILWSPDLSGAILYYNEMAAAARSLRVELQSIEIRRAEDLDRAFSETTGQRAQGFIVDGRNPVLFGNRAKIAKLAQTTRQPIIYGQSEYPDVGGLMSYGPNIPDRYRNAATYVDKILKGAKPADLPVEQPARFELVINMKAAKALGITIPTPVMVRADRVIE